MKAVKKKLRKGIKGVLILMPWWWPFKKRSENQILEAQFWENILLLMNLVRVQLEQSNYDKALQYANEAKKKAEEAYEKFKALTDNEGFNLLSTMPYTMGRLVNHISNKSRGAIVNISDTEKKAKKRLKKL